jgi:hypothetical protein
MKRKLKVRIDGSWSALRGRTASAFGELYRAGSRGCTPIDNPGPRRDPLGGKAVAA